MKRRDFSLASMATVATASGLFGALPAHAQSAAPQAGNEYVVLTPAQSNNAPAGKTEVIEFFWYSCPHCYQFEPLFDAWAAKQPNDVVIHRVPIAFQQNANFVPQQKLYFTLESMGLLPTLHVAVFEAIHKERKRLIKDEDIFSWVESKGVDRKQFEEVYNSFAVANSVRRATQIQDDYRLEGVPALAVAGKYYTDGSKAGSMGKALDVVDVLVQQERKAR